MAVELLDQVPSVVLAVYSHPDDADIACAGTLARWVRAGADVHLVICTNGGKGTKDPALMPTVLANQRALEVEDSSKVTGISSHISLGQPDGEIENSSALRSAIVAQIRRVRPDVVCGHDPTAVFFGQEYFNHRDHREVGWALLDALSPAAALPHYFPDSGPPHQVNTVLLSGTLEPNVWVDISDTIELKVNAVECHRSQFYPVESWAGTAVRARAQAEGRRAGVSYAEGFRRVVLAL